MGHDPPVEKRRSRLQCVAVGTGDLGPSGKPLPLWLPGPRKKRRTEKHPEAKSERRHALALQTPTNPFPPLRPPLRAFMCFLPGRRRPAGGGNIHPWSGNQSKQSVQCKCRLCIPLEGGRTGRRSRRRRRTIGPVSREGALDLHRAPVSLRGSPPGEGALGGGGCGCVRDAGGLHRVSPDADVLPPSLQDRAQPSAPRRTRV